MSVMPGDRAGFPACTRAVLPASSTAFDPRIRGQPAGIAYHTEYTQETPALQKCWFAYVESWSATYVESWSATQA